MKDGSSTASSLHIKFMDTCNAIYKFIENVFLSLGVLILAHGPAVPHHIAMVMDGNRRWARNRHLERQQGHLFGYLRLSEILQWCEKLGTKVVTVFAFSTENFKRPKEEVDALMQMAKEKFDELASKESIVKKFDMRVQVLGRLELLPEDVQQSARKIMELTRDRKNIILNICLAYTSTEEISYAIEECAASEGGDGVTTAADLSRKMYRGDMPDPDVLIRTSGETRLSDFLTWQTSSSMLSFLSVMWPDFSAWHLLSTVLQYQYHYKHIEKCRHRLTSLDRARDN